MAATQPTGADDNLANLSLLNRFREVRSLSRELVAPLAAEDTCVQSMADASPSKWHLAHVTWFFETFILEPNIEGFAPYDPEFRYLFNSYYNGIGEQYSRPHRGMITRPTLDRVMNYREAIDASMESLIPDAGSEVQPLVELGLHHEQQHQELLLMDIKHLFSLNPTYPAYAEHIAAAAPVAPASWIPFSGGLITTGADPANFHFDNEMPRHENWVHSFELNNRLVSNAEYLAFIEDGGYSSPLLWLADGWATVSDLGWDAPADWHRQDGQWFEFTLGGLRPLDMNAPVCHVSYFEADAFAQWSGARLPTEFEWELAARQSTVAAPFSLHPGTADDVPGALSQMFGHCWQWTRSAYLPYPGFKAAAGAVGEYNGKFMSNQMVLRGSACITPPGHARASYRNFFYPHQRWPFTGIRLARDLADASGV